MDKLERLASPKHQEQIDQLMLLRMSVDKHVDISEQILEYKQLQAQRDHELVKHFKKSSKTGFKFSIVMVLLATIAFTFDFIKFTDEAQLHIDEIIPKFFGKQS